MPARSSRPNTSCPAAHAVDALLASPALRATIEPLVQVSEIRTVAADELWLSTAFGRPSVAIHFTWQPDWDGRPPVLPLIEAALAPFEPRPHWGKLFTMAPDAVRSGLRAPPGIRGARGAPRPGGQVPERFLERYVVGGR